MSGKGRNTSIIIAIITSLSVVVAAIIDVAFRGGKAPDATGEITMPAESGSVSSPLLVMGTLKDIPKDHAVYMVVEKGEIIWPQEPQISSQDRRWSVSIGLKGIEPGEPFNLALICAKPDAQKQITRWLAQNNFKQNPMGLRKPEGIFRLDIVSQLTLAGSYRTQTPLSRAADTTIVYRTSTGRKYHQKLCPSLRKSKIKITLSEARNLGLQPCKRCSPPE